MDSRRSDKLRFHVTFGTAKQIIEVASCEEIIEAIYNSFEVTKAFDLQYFDKEFDDWVDVRKFSSIPAKSRLKVVKSSYQSNIDAGHQSSDSDDVLELSDSSDPPKPSDSDDIPQQTSDCCTKKKPRVSFLASLFSNDLNDSATSNVSFEETSTSTDLDDTAEHLVDETVEHSVDEPVPDWISSYELPQFPKYVTAQLEVLKNTQALDARVRRQIVTILFQSIVCHTRYPARDEYSTVLNLLISKYPALKDRYFSKSRLKHASWLQSLRNRFKEHRRSLTDDPMHELMQRKYGGRKKRKPSSGSDVSLSIRCKKLRTSVYSIAEHLESSDTEDEFSMKIHLQAMKDALKRNHLDARLLSDRMSRTFMYRRKAILSGKSTEKILEDYPCFRFPEWILEEMIRIVKVDLLDVLGKLDPAKMKKIKTLGLEKWSKMTLRTKSLIDRDEVCWILVLHDLTNTSGFVYEKNPATPYPAIIFDESDLLMVTVDNQTIGNISSFSCAICCVLALYWVLNIDFPSSQKKFLTFLAKYVFGIPGIDYMPGLMGIMNSL